MSSATRSHRSATRRTSFCEGAAASPIVLAHAASVIERQVQHMTRLVDDLLDVARFTSGKIILRRERVDVIRSWPTRWRPIAHRRRNKNSRSLPPCHRTKSSSRWTPPASARCLSNLLDNAIKYTEAGGSIRVSLEPGADAVEIRVRDTGIGIEGDMLEKIFALFTQAERGRGRSHGGLGIGLMLVHSLVTMHGGTVHALSEGPGTGSEFVVRFPRD